MSHLLLSAVVPNYNHGRFIGAAIQALLDQTLPLDEIIIVDDGSTDDSVATIERLVEVESRIRLIRHDLNKGAIEALNTGLRAARGDYVYLAAADDVSQPNLMATLLAAISKHPEAAFASGEVLLVNETGEVEVRPPVRPIDITRYFTRSQTVNLFRSIDNFLLTGAALLRLSAVREAGYLRPEVAALADGLLLRQMAFRHGFVYVPEPLAEWRVSGKGLSRSAALDAKTTALQLNAAHRLLTDDPAVPPWYWEIFRRRFIFATLRIALMESECGLGVVRAHAPGPPLLKPLFTALARGGWLARTVCLAWATLWYRPTSLRRLALTGIARHGTRADYRVGRSSRPGER